MAVRHLYDATIITPLTIDDVIPGEILWGAIRGVIMAAIILTVLAALGLVASPWACPRPPAAAFQSFMVTSMSMCYATIAPSVNSLNFYFSLIVYPVFFIGGVSFPLDHLPELAQRGWPGSCRSPPPCTSPEA